MSSVSTNRIITSTTPIFPKKSGADEVFYPESDGKPMGETGIHIRLILELIQTLSTFYASNPGVYVIGDILLYYREGDPKKFVVPDVLVSFDTNKEERRSYKVWEERKAPEVIFEISSKSTWQKDLRRKYDLYQELGVKEYYIFDPDYLYLPEPLVGYHLKNNRFVKVNVEKDGIFSFALNLIVFDTGETLRLFNPETEKFLPTSEELATTAKEFADQTEKLITINRELAAKTKEFADQTDELATKAEQLESENKLLKAELEKLKKQK